MKVIRKDDCTAVVILEKTMDILNSSQLKESLKKLYEEGVSEIKVDFSNTSYIDGTCLGKLLMFQGMLKKRHGSLSIINVQSEYLRSLFEMINIDRVIDVDYKK